MISIRDETPSDRAAVFAVNAAAFPTDAEARLVDALRERARPLISLVAVNDERVVGHILFSPVRIRDAHTPLLMGLAPMAVAPDHQRRGIGSGLVREGLQRCRALGAGAVVVLGHPAFYPRFGFAPATSRGIECEYDASPGAWMLLELTPHCLDGVRGTVEYHEAFRSL